MWDTRPRPKSVLLSIPNEESRFLRRDAVNHHGTLETWRNGLLRTLNGLLPGSHRQPPAQSWRNFGTSLAQARRPTCGPAEQCRTARSRACLFSSSSILSIQLSLISCYLRLRLYIALFGRFYFIQSLTVCTYNYSTRQKYWAPWTPLSFSCDISYTNANINAKNSAPSLAFISHIV